MKIEDTTPKLLNSITEHPDVQRLIGQIVKLQIKLGKEKTQREQGMAAIDRHRCALLAENKRLKKALERFGHHDDPCLALLEMGDECICSFAQALAGDKQ